MTRRRILFTRCPGQCYCSEHEGLAYQEPSWWAVEWEGECGPGGHTLGRPVAGPCGSRREVELEVKLRLRNRQIRDLRRSLRK